MAARLALGFALLGLGSSAAAAYTHYQLLTNPSYTTVCDVSATVSCSQVYASAYGTVAGTSVAVFGAIGFGLATLLALGGLLGGATMRENVPGYLFAGSTLALSVVIYLGYASFVILKLVCVFCLGTYVATVGLFLVSGAGATMPLSSLPGRAVSDLRRMASSPLAVAVAVAFVAASAFGVIAFPREHAVPDTATLLGEAAGEERAAFQQWYEAQRRLPPPVPADGARVLIVKFNDYQCPACAQTYRDYQAVLARFTSAQPGAVRMVTLDFPLESECNAGVTSTLHEGACEAAVAVRLAREHGRAAALEEHLYTNQPAMTPAQVRTWAREIGEVTDFEARYEATLAAVRADVARGLELGVRSTPTFLINGTVVEGGLPPHLLEQAIQYELSRAEK
jgi:uncharacterized membrane protein/predicted DsbA family dithiol-disulfide isomerase